MLRWAKLLICCVPVFDQSLAADLKSATSKEGREVIYLSGEIMPGDANSFAGLVQRANAAGRLVSAIRLDSQGGNLLEGMKLAAALQTAKIATVVPNGNVCASACFLIFAAGSEKYASFNAQVGVHGASDENGRETSGTAAATIGMARASKELGVPEKILGKMVVTPHPRLCG